jgi:hypothetical protein
MPALKPAQSPQPRSDHVALGEALLRKFQNPAYAEALASRSRRPPPSFGMAEEGPIRDARSKLAAARRAPPGTALSTIPRAAAAPTIDGVAEPAEWRGALRIPLQPAERQAWVMLLAHGGTLYLAAHAPGDRTADGFDQFRFWFHLELSPFMENERVFISRSGPPNALRGARLPRNGVFDETADPRTLQSQTDWYVYGRARAAATITGYRQFELAVDLAEAGLFAGVPFPAFLEIEGDPIYEAGKFKARVMEGTAGSAKQPIWLQVAK